MATIIVLAIIALGCYIYYLSNGNHEETQKQSETPSQPAQLTYWTRVVIPSQSQK